MFSVLIKTHLKKPKPTDPKNMSQTKAKKYIYKKKKKKKNSHYLPKERSTNIQINI